MTLPIERLDRSRPHGSVHGERTNGIAFTQRALGIEDWPYSAQGELIETLLSKTQRDKLAEKRDAAENGSAPSTAPVTEAPEEEIEPDAPKPVVDDEDVNLEMWLRGEASYKWSKVQKAILRRFSANKPEKRQAALYLVEEKKLLPRAQVHTSILPPAPAEAA